MGDPSAGRSSLVKVIFQKMMASQTVVLGITNKMETYEFQISKL